MSTPTAGFSTGSSTGPDRLSPADNTAENSAETSTDNGAAGTPPEAGGCAHCDGSVPHKHVDVATAVREADERLAARGRRDVGLGVGLLVVVLVASAVALLGYLPTLWAALVGIVGWAAAMVLGLLVVALYGRRNPGSVQRAPDGRPLGAPHRATVLAGVAVSVLVAPTGLLAATAGGEPWGAVTGAAGWLAAAGIAQAGSTRSVRELLVTQGPQGEAARQAAVHGELPHGPGLSWLWHGLGVAVWGALAAVLPLTLIVALPLHVAISLLLARTSGDARR